jgi:hypothetical protein
MSGKRETKEERSGKRKGRGRAEGGTSRKRRQRK